ncbi:MAG: preprotein translocase subunit SecE, partial [gamma proteobacterium symbiont of Ctena orbiculata]
EFASASRIEVRKVVWPSRQETVQTTLIVFVMVLIMGIVLWLFDMMLGAILKALTGTG